MNTPITMELILEIIAVIVAVQGFFKAVEWAISKITSQHDKSQKIDENSESLEEYIRKTDQEIANLNKRVTDAHNYASDTLETFEKNIKDEIAEQKKDYMKHLKEDKEEYLEGIKRVEASILEMQAVYQQTVAIVDIKIENLTKQVEKHNSVVERTYGLEKDVAVLKQQIGA